MRAFKLVKTKSLWIKVKVSGNKTVHTEHICPRCGVLCLIPSSYCPHCGHKNIKYKKVRV